MASNKQKRLSGVQSYGPYLFLSEYTYFTKAILAELLSVTDAFSATL